MCHGSPSSLVATPARGEFLLEQTSLPVSDAISLRKTSRGFGWSGLYAALTDERAHEALHRAVPAVWLATTFTGIDLARCIVGGEKTHNQFQKNLVSITAPGETVHDVIGSPVMALHAYLGYDVLEEVLAELYPDRYSTTRVLSVFATEDLILNRFLQCLVHALHEPVEASSLVADYLSRAIAAHLIHRYSTKGIRVVPRAGDTLSANQFRLVLDYIEAHLDCLLTVGALAGLLGLSKTRFLVKFRTSTNMTPYQYVIIRRIRRAEVLLEQSSLNILEIAIQCGFADHAHLTSTFRRVVGRPASEYRRGQLTANPAELVA
jgi:AraC family transcriptional regulator